MQSYTRNVRLSIAIAAVLGSSAALAQQASGNLEEVVVTGTRKIGQSATETISPVDLLSGESLSQQATFDLTEGLPRISPALNTQRFPIADGTAFIRPVTLRNLAPDQTLVLVNGTRRHRSALVNLQLAPLGTVNQGSQGVDFAAFPAAAIERVEILRDGASAQYGSDAIAGVVNVILKSGSEGGTASAQYGSYYEGDGTRLSVSGDIGLPVTSDGFVNLAAEYSTSDITWRGHPRPDAAELVDILGKGVVPLRGYGQRWGDPDVEALKFSVNSGVKFSDAVEAYGFGTYMDNTTKSDFFYRRPVLEDPALQQQLSARTTLQIDNNNDGLPDPAPQSLVSSIQGQGLNPADYLVASATSPSGYVLRNPIYTDFPGGYNPNFGADLTDYEGVLGLRGDLMPHLSWDLRGRYGQSEVDYKLSGSINPSLGRLSPLKFKPGKLTQEESGVNLDFVKSFENSPLNIAFGTEWRDETYKIQKGDEASISAGPTAAVFGVGSDGFQGFPAEAAGDFDSTSWAVYGDLETDVTKQFSVGLALRYEDYDKFGNTTDWKVSGRYNFTESFAIRGTANTGFRVPTPGQVNTLNVTTTADSSGNLIPNGTYPVSNPIAIALGAVPLKPEQSTNYTLGLVWTAGQRTSVTVDYYHIDIEKRLALLSNTIDQAAVDQLTAAGIENAQLLLGSNANFFVNGFDSEVQGVDLALTSAFDVGGGTLVADLRHNYNDQKISNVKPNTIDDARVYDLEHQIPKNRSVLTLNWNSDVGLGALLRLNYYDSWSTTAGLFNGSNPPDTYDYGSSLLVDAEVGYTFNKMFTVTLGGENVFDQKPDKEGDPTLQFLGDKYALTSPYGFNGGFYYLRLAAHF